MAKIKRALGKLIYGSVLAAQLFGAAGTLQAKDNGSWAKDIGNGNNSGYSAIPPAGPNPAQAISSGMYTHIGPFIIEGFTYPEYLNSDEISAVKYQNLSKVYDQAANIFDQLQDGGRRKEPVCFFANSLETSIGLIGSIQKAAVGQSAGRLASLMDYLEHSPQSPSSQALAEFGKAVAQDSAIAAEYMAEKYHEKAENSTVRDSHGEIMPIHSIMRQKLYSDSQRPVQVDTARSGNISLPSAHNQTPKDRSQQLRQEVELRTWETFYKLANKAIKEDITPGALNSPNVAESIKGQLSALATQNNLQAPAYARSNAQGVFGGSRVGEVSGRQGVYGNNNRQSSSNPRQKAADPRLAQLSQALTRSEVALGTMLAYTDYLACQTDPVKQEAVKEKIRTLAEICALPTARQVLSYDTIPGHSKALSSEVSDLTRSHQQNFERRYGLQSPGMEMGR